MADALKSAAATEMVAQQQADGKGRGRMGSALDREVVMQLFKKWVRSDDRDKVGSLAEMTTTRLAILLSGHRQEVWSCGQIRIDVETSWVCSLFYIIPPAVINEETI